MILFVCIKVNLVYIYESQYILCDEKVVVVAGTFYSFIFSYCGLKVVCVCVMRVLYNDTHHPRRNKN